MITDDNASRSNVVFKNGLKLPKLIGLTGKARSGKDTVARYLKNVYGYEQLAFAAALKNGVRAMFGWGYDETDGDLKETVIPWIGKSPRQVMQSLGTEWGRQCVKESLWTDIVEQQARALMYNAGLCVVVSDVRFDNEAEMVLKNGGIVLNIVRPDAMAVNSHASEAGVDKSLVSFTIHNDGTIRQLCDAVDYAIGFPKGD